MVSTVASSSTVVASSTAPWPISTSVTASMSTPRSTLVFSESAPAPMPPESVLESVRPVACEVERIVKQIVIAAEKPKPKLEYSVGESVRIVDGPFSNFTGQVEEVNQDRLTLKVMVTIFGRATPVELEFLQVQKP